MSDTPLLQLRNITKTFGSVQALDDVDFEVHAGEVMALVGDNGAGKSTLVKCVAGTHSPDSGTILFEGREVNIHGPKDAARLVYSLTTMTPDDANTSWARLWLCHPVVWLWSKFFAMTATGRGTSW